ncbi:hypothetical protein LG047_13360 [Methylocystis sp. WRRC1]|uniref:hypothetical protein n=1 Tax=Methylocystis sp. WRRC1 TaxID=1732014 RepID=UPI001D14EFC6|nr:hypothetical protein [Methylocystis sp. WRRC1]MCC3246296.1 hypothetical protein [Methylocystis sp. WRRC1]
MAGKKVGEFIFAEITDFDDRKPVETIDSIETERRGFKRRNAATHPPSSAFRRDFVRRFDAPLPGGLNERDIAFGEDFLIKQELRGLPMQRCAAL